MELRHLRYSTTVAQTRHFGQAAERLLMAQPPLSQQIRQLEAELGVDLLTRTTRQVALTPAGEVFYADAVRILKSVESAERHVRKFAAGKSGTLRMGFTGSASYRQLPEMARLVHEFLPGLALEIQTDMLTPDQETALIASELDIAVLRPPTRSDGISLRTIDREPLVLALPQQHPLTSLTSVTMADLRAERFIMHPESSRSVVSDAIVRSCLASGFYPQVEHESGKTSTVLSLVAAGLGIAIVPDSARGMALSGVVFRDLIDAETVELALAWRRDDHSPLLTSLLRVLESNHFFRLPFPNEVHLEDH